MHRPDPRDHIRHDRRLADRYVVLLLLTPVAVLSITSLFGAYSQALYWFWLVAVLWELILIALVILIYAGWVLPSNIRDKPVVFNLPVNVSVSAYVAFGLGIIVLFGTGAVNIITHDSPLNCASELVEPRPSVTCQEKFIDEKVSEGVQVLGLTVLPQNKFYTRFPVLHRYQKLGVINGTENILGAIVTRSPANLIPEVGDQWLVSEASELLFTYRVPPEISDLFILGAMPVEPDLQFTVAAWNAASGFVAYKRTFSVSELESLDWKVTVVP